MTYKNRKELVEFLAYVIVFGPKEFPDDANLDMDTVFRNIRDSILYCTKELGGEDKVTHHLSILDKAKSELEIGNDLIGLHLLQDLRSAL